MPDAASCPACESLCLETTECFMKRLLSVVNARKYLLHSYCDIKMSSKTPRLQVSTLRTRIPTAVERPPSLISNSTSSEGDESFTPPERESALDLRSLGKALNNVAVKDARSSSRRTMYRQSTETPLYLTEPFVSNSLVQGKFK